MSKEISEAFLYSTSARDLWLDLQERFGGCNGPLIYKIQREIATVNQGNFSIVAYYTKLKRLWDELAVLIPVPDCPCGSQKAHSDLTSLNRLMQFLIGLNSCFEHTRSQLLAMDPLPFFLGKDIIISEASD
jgi:hypothetical protein